MKEETHEEQTIAFLHALVGQVSHDMRTPITSILGYAGILGNDVPEPLKQFVQQIKVSAHSLQHIMTAMDQLYLLRKKGEELHLEMVDVSAKLEGALEQVRPMAQEKGLALTASAPDMPAYVDGSYLDMLFFHLFCHIASTAEEGAFHVSLQEEETGFSILVAASRGGVEELFPEEAMAALAETTLTDERNIERLGIRLTLVKHLVLTLKAVGALKVDEQGRTAFSLFLPCPKSPIAAKFGTLPDPAAKAIRKPGRPHILIVEDNVPALKLMEIILQEHYDVTLASRAAEAIDYASDQVFDLVLMDINLGLGKTGVEVMQSIRAFPGYSEIPILASTAYALPGETNDFLDQGFSGTLYKPFRKQQLLETVEQALSG